MTGADPRAALPVIEVADVSKAYARGFGLATRRGLRAIAGEVLAQRGAPPIEVADGEFLALDAVSFVVGQGEVFGVLGVNGAGKSTLLRIMAGISKPTSGEVVVRGTVGVLLDATGGFDPLLSGRENVRASYALWDLPETEMDEAVAEILEFADLGSAVEAPLRTYSMGMRMRLSFATSIHRAPDLLLIDEALSVGDVRFQQRCEARIRRYTDAGGTLVVVTHSLPVVQGLCARAIVLDRGRVCFGGSSQDAVAFYAEMLADRERLQRSEVALPSVGPTEPASTDEVPEDSEPTTNRLIDVVDVTIAGPNGGNPVTGRPAEVAAVFRSSIELVDASWGVILTTPDGLAAIAADVTDESERVHIHRGANRLSAAYERFPLMPGPYMLRLAILDMQTRAAVGLHGFDTPATFFVVDPAEDSSDSPSPLPKPIVDVGTISWWSEVMEPGSAGGGLGATVGDSLADDS